MLIHRTYPDGTEHWLTDAEDHALTIHAWWWDQQADAALHRHDLMLHEATEHPLDAAHFYAKADRYRETAAIYRAEAHARHDAENQANREHRSANPNAA